MTATMASDSLQRAVILAGPHKSASSSTQCFFANNLSKKARQWYRESGRPDLVSPSFRSWDWPGHLPFRGTGRIQQATFFKQHHQIVKRKEYRRRFRAEVKRSLRNGNSVVVGTELLDEVGEEGRDGFVMGYLAGLFGSVRGSGIPRDRVRVVLMYRHPRVDHLISIWKQQVNYVARAKDPKFKNARFKDWVCGESKWMPGLPQLLATQANPLGVAVAFRRHGYPVSLVDMSGVARDGRDISHVISCEILGVPCTKGGVVVGVSEEVEVKNKRSTKLERLDLDEEGIQRIEGILNRLDCRHRQGLERDEQVKVHHPDQIYQFACDEKDLAYTYDEAYADIRRVVQCEEDAIAEKTKPQKAKKTTPKKRRPATKPNPAAETPNPVAGTVYETEAVVVDGQYRLSRYYWWEKNLLLVFTAGAVLHFFLKFRFCRRKQRRTAEAACQKARPSHQNTRKNAADSNMGIQVLKSP